MLKTFLNKQFFQSVSIVYLFCSKRSFQVCSLVVFFIFLYDFIVKWLSLADQAQQDRRKPLSGGDDSWLSGGSQVIVKVWGLTEIDVTYIFDWTLLSSLRLCNVRLWFSHLLSDSQKRQLIFIVDATQLFLWS